MAGKRKVGRKRGRKGHSSKTHIVPSHLMGKTLHKRAGRKRSRKH